MSIPSRFPSSADARKAGWLSRRHETRAACMQAQAAYDVRREEKRAREQAQAERTRQRREAA